MRMRMPVLSYFVVVGSVLLGLLYWAGDKGASEGSAFKTSQTVGIPKSFSPQPQQQQPLPEVTTVNFASEYDQPEPKAAKPVEAKPAKSAETKRKDKTTVGYRPTWNRFVEYPHDNLSIH
jgi:hypothetical protein